MDEGEDGTSWFDTNIYNVSTEPPFVAVVDNLVNVMELAEAVNVGAEATVPVAATPTISRVSAVGVNESDAYDVVLDVLAVPLVIRLVTVATCFSNKNTALRGQPKATSRKAVSLNSYFNKVMEIITLRFISCNPYAALSLPNAIRNGNSTNLGKVVMLYDCNCNIVGLRNRA